jgi:uncharacterized protein
MPVRSLSSSVLVWPTRDAVDNALRQWAAESRARHADVVRIGCFGSFARGGWGVGSDLDLIVVVRHSDIPFERRGVAWDLTELPVSADLLVYTEAEWESLLASETRFARMLQSEVKWL